MFIGALPPVSNRAGWTFTREVVDDDTDEPVDLSSCSLVMEIRDQRGGNALLSASTDASTITVRDTGVFDAVFTRAQMASLCARTYDVGLTVKNGDAEPEQFIIGTLPVLDGVIQR
jgi:hypothetical protein